MIIIVIMMIWIFLSINRNIENKTDKNKVLVCMIGAMIIQSIWLILYRTNLSYIGREVYFSDAEAYWNATKKLLLGETIIEYNRLYIYICYFIQKTSPLIWVGWNNIFNILCIDLTVTMIINIAYKNAKCKDIKKITLLMFYTLYNPLIIYSLMRNLKDALFLLMITLIGYLLELNIYKKIVNCIPFLAFLIISIPILYNIRPWGFLISIVALLLFINERYNMKNTKRNIQKLGILIVATVMCFIAYKKIPIINSTLNMWVPIVLKSSTTRSVFDNVLGIAKLFVGPGPIRSMFGNNYFMFTTSLGNIMSTIGAIVWYWELSRFIAGIKSPIKKVRNTNIFIKYMIITIILYILIYVMQYGGSTELRFRGVLYIIISTIGFGICEIKNDSKSICVSGVIFCILLLSNLFFI